MSYCIAFSVDGGAIDVSKAYIPLEKWGEKGEVATMRATAGPEAAGEVVLQRIRERRRMGIPAEEKARLTAEDDRDRTWWNSSSEISSSSSSSAEASHTEEALLPRQSGTQEWKEQRGEAGK